MAISCNLFRLALTLCFLALVATPVQAQRLVVKKSQNPTSPNGLYIGTHYTSPTPKTGKRITYTGLELRAGEKAHTEQAARLGLPEGTPVRLGGQEGEDVHGRAGVTEESFRNYVLRGNEGTSNIGSSGIDGVFPHRVTRDTDLRTNRRNVAPSQAGGKPGPTIRSRQRKSSQLPDRRTRPPQERHRRR